MRLLTIAALLLFCAGCGAQDNAGGNAADGQQPAAKQAKKPRKREGVINKTTDEVVNLQEYLKRPEIQELGNRKIPIADPVTQATSAYMLLAPKAGTLGMQQWVKTFQATNERVPTYDEFIAFMKKERIKFPKIRPYELYAYDELTGEISVIEDIEKKNEILGGN